MGQSGAARIISEREGGLAGDCEEDEGTELVFYQMSSINVIWLVSATFGGKWTKRDFFLAEYHLFGSKFGTFLTEFCHRREMQKSCFGRTELTVPLRVSVTVSE